MGIENISKHQKDYFPEIWKQYTLEELGKWVHLFTKRAGHRTNLVKAKKDIYDARNYLAMMGEIINEAEGKVLAKLM